MSEIEALFGQANAAAVDEDYDTAASLYDKTINEAIKQSIKPSAQHYVARATNSIKRKQYQCKYR